MSQRFTGMGGHHGARAGTDEWLTPPFVLDALGGASSFDLDPCSPVDRPWPTAREHFTILDNGLLKRWLGRIWLNPPYSAHVIGRWLARMAEHGHGVALIFARTETEAFHRHVWERASAVRFLEGRLNFHHVSGKRSATNAGAPSVLCGYGDHDVNVLSDCDLPGQFIPLRLPRLFLLGMVLPTWRRIVYDTVSAQDGPVALSDLYRALASHPKAQGRQHYKAKIRQVLQCGPFRRVSRGTWEVA